MNDLEELGGRLLVIFDGHCGLCNRSVQWLLVRDKRNRLCFAASESPKVAGLLIRRGFSATGSASDIGTLLVVQDPGSSAERVLARSDAVLALLGELLLPWPWVATAVGWIPRPVRDLGYRLVARWRYRIWGRLENCTAPTAEERKRFL